MHIDDICFLDTETKTRVPGGDVTVDGTYRYMKNAHVIIKTYAIGNEPVACIAPIDAYETGLEERDMPIDLLRFRDRVAAGKAKFAAWNAGFDRQAVATIDDGFAIGPTSFIDIMAQAVASNLPASLEGAARFIGRDGKHPDGKALIKTFCTYGMAATPWTHPTQWATFLDYGITDTDLLRDIFRHTRPLSDDEWLEYWASETINDRGMAVDIRLCEAASAIADADRARTNELLNRFTNGQITSVHQHQRIADWLWDALEYSEARAILVSKFDEDVDADEGSGGLVATKLSAERDRVTRLIAFMQAKAPLSERDETILRVLQLREFGASSTPKKFDKVLAQHVDGAVFGQYVFNGANQTGRFSAKGVQVHNLTRSTLGAREAEAIELICSLQED